jgi:DNA repair protein RecN (Recombination protein N)
MLHTLRIRNLVIIEDLSVEFGPGLNLLTGETGAGKSILVEALGLATGARADRAAIRAGETKATVEALFVLPPRSTLHELARERGIDGLEEGQLVVRREVSAAGSGRILVNGSPCTLALLRELGDELLELHGQHEHHGLRVPERHLELLDAFGAHADAVARVQWAHDAVQAARRRLEWLRENAAEREARIERAERAVRQIDALQPRPGELEALERERRLLQNAGHIVRLLDEVVGLSYEGEPAAAALAAAAGKRAEELARLDPALAELAERCRSAAVELQDIGTGFRDYRDRSNFDPSRLEELEARGVALERLCLAHGVDESGLLQLREEEAAELLRLRGLDDELDAAASGADGAEAAYVVAAQALGRSRKAAARRLASAVEAELESLALGKARFRVALAAARGSLIERGEGQALPLGPRGAERVEFQLAANPGEPLRPLNQVASGGELSRLMLALHVVADNPAGGHVLVFDEVDAGIGGAVADAVGARLARLARRHQVLCVTHLPQIAAYADTHYRVEKSVSQGRTAAAIASLSARARVDELARMLGGKRATQASRKHASELLAAAGRNNRTPSRRQA